MKLIYTLLISLFFFNQLDAQKVFGTRNGKVSFQATDDDDVKAVNNEATSRLSDNGQLSFSLLIKGFKFKMAEMQDHFNDQYLESSKFPRADFKGLIVNMKEVNFGKDGSYKITVKGDLTMHGITKNITANGILDIKAGKPVASAKFTVSMKDFKIDAGSVTEKVIIDISCQYQ